MSADIAVVITVHGEGRILVPTLRSVAAAAERASEAGYGVEVVVVLDRIDEETRRVVDSHVAAELSEATSVRAIEVDNGDLGVSRNDGIASSTAPVVAVLDGDNLVSRDWLVAGAKAIAAGVERTIAHPEIIASFGARHTLWALTASSDADFRPELLAVVNPWDACVMAPREVFEEVPYLRLPPSEGYGPEDWSWNLETLDRGARHVVVAGTALFYRVRPGSLLAEHGGSLLPPLSFLGSGERAREVVRRHGARHVPPAPTARDTFRQVVPYPVRRVARDGLRGVRAALRPGVRVVRRALNGAPQTAPGRTLAPWLEGEWRAANRIEPEIPFPRAHAVDGYQPWGHPWGAWDEERALAYWRVLDAVGEDVDFLFVAPWVRTGGGDRVMLQYVAAVRRLEPLARIVLLTTEPDESTRLQDVPAGVRVVQLRQFFAPFVDREWMVGSLLPQLLTQLAPRTIHIFNSTVGYDVLERFGRTLSRHTALFLSTFVLDRTPDGERTSVLFYRHSRFLQPIDAVLVDSEAFAATMVREQGYDADKFRVQRQIVPELTHATPRHRGPFDAANPLRVLWAGRFDLQKRLDVLADVAEEIVRRGLPVRIDFYGEAVMGDPALESHLARLEAAGAIRHGAYQDIAHLPLDEYGAFLMTSEWEGVPNTLLEVMAAGMPAVAPLVGGVSEVLDESTGFPVLRFDDAGAYADALEAVIGNFAAAVERADRSRALVRSTFSAAAFDEGLRALPAYLTGRESEEAVEEPVEEDEQLVEETIGFYADAETAEFLRSDAPRVQMFAGSAGYANLGDILQHKNVLAQWARFAPDRAPVSVFHVGSARDVEHLAALRAWYGTRHLVFFARSGEQTPDWLTPIDEVGGGPSPVHVVGGGYLNAEWGPGYLAVMEAMGDVFGATEYLFSGMQIDEFIQPALAEFDSRRPVAVFGTRDPVSFERAREVFGARAAQTFDDLWEIISVWRPRAVERTSGPFRLGLHINASAYVGDDVVAHITDLLEQVRAAHPDVRITLLNAYDDDRLEVMDTFAALRLFGDSLPFDRFDAVDLAKVALDAPADGGTPAAVAGLELDAAITCSYHTTMIMNALGVPAFLIRRSEYYAQKAAIFGLPDDFATFLAEPARYVKDFTAEDAVRRAWVARLGEWIVGDRASLEGPA